MSAVVEASKPLRAYARSTLKRALISALPLLLALPHGTSAEGLWDRVKEGAARTYERSGELVKEGADKGLEVGGELAEKGLQAGKEAVGDAAGHFYREGTSEDIRARVDKLAFDTLDRLFGDDPEAHLLFDSGYGYAVFEVRQVSLTVTAGYGYGVAVGADGSQRVYMKMATGGVGFSKGVGGFASEWVVLFEDEEAFRGFVEQGFDASAEATGLVGTEQAGLAARYRQGTAFYRVTKGGLMVAAAVTGTRFWPDPGLN
jgi:lipid-binding SYLF domain-containing protein